MEMCYFSTAKVKTGFQTDTVTFSRQYMAPLPIAHLDWRTYLSKATTSNNK